MSVLFLFALDTTSAANIIILISISELQIQFIAKTHISHAGGKYGPIRMTNGLS